MPHIHEKIDFTADVFIVYKNTVLLRKHDKYKIWLPPGGHIELDEDPNHAAIREVKEEVGLNVQLADCIPPIQLFNDSQSLIPPRFLNRHSINTTHEHISFVYFAIATNNKIQQGNKEISDEIQWFTDQELDNQTYHIKDKTKYYAHAALKELGTIL
jgi:ADP-ribose pyrophosphatase YjhB (NUDIX family)